MNYELNMATVGVWVYNMVNVAKCSAYVYTYVILYMCGSSCTISYVQVVVASLGILSLGNWGLIDDWPKHWG